MSETENDELVDLLKACRGTCWIVGEPGKGKLCIRITEDDRLRLLHALRRPWWAFWRVAKEAEIEQLRAHIRTIDAQSITSTEANYVAVPSSVIGDAVRACDG